MHLEPELRNRLRRGDYQSVIAEARKTRRREGLNKRVLQRLGAAALCAGDPDNAGECLRAAERLPRADAVALFRAWAEACAACRFYDRALRLVQSALPAARQFPDVWLEYAHYALALGRVGHAREAVEKYLAHQPENAATHELIARCAFATGSASSARFHALRALRLDPDAIGALRVLGGLREKKLDPEILQRFEQRLDADPGDERERAHLGFALGSLFEARGTYDKAFRAYRKANRAQAAATPPSAREADLAVLRESLVKVLRGVPPAPVPASGPRPVFVVGMPRSGTTLIEQILARHPAAEALGERPELPGAVSALTGDRGRPAASQFIAELAARYRQSPAGQTDVIVDKQPVNFAWLELIEKTFPDAVIVRLHRHPGDVCISNYASPIRPEMAFATDVDTILDYIDVFVRTCVETPEALRPRVLEFQYEKLVAEPEAGIRRLLAHCGLEWSARCLQFHADDRVIDTISAVQVRNPLHRGSIGRWHRFGDELAHWRPRIEALAARQAQVRRRIESAA